MRDKIFSVDMLRLAKQVTIVDVAVDEEGPAHLLAAIYDAIEEHGVCVIYDAGDSELRGIADWDKESLPAILKRRIGDGLDT